MTCEACKVSCQRFGKHRNGLRRFRCPQCKKTYTEAHQLTLGEMLRIPMMSISQSDLMPIRSERSDARLSQCESVIGIRQQFCSV